jgi:hypothetical protein
LLYHNAYLERPSAQLDWYHLNHLPTSRHIVYGLGSKGEAVLKQGLGVAPTRSRRGEKNRSVGRIFLEHALLVSDIMVSIELACRQNGRIRLLTDADLPLPDQLRRQHQPFNWRVEVNSRTKLGIIPDRVFALEFPNTNGNRERVLFFLEADRGTMPVIRRSLSQTSFYRKLLAYEATWAQSIHRTRFGFNRFRVLTVTKSTARLHSLIQACSRLERGHGLFLFTDISSLKTPSDIFSPIWHTATEGQTESILD